MGFGQGRFSSPCQLIQVDLVPGVFGLLFLSIERPIEDHLASRRTSGSLLLTENAVSSFLKTAFDRGLNP
jgi:hypothetical protein